MPAEKILVLYASTHGHTGKIATRIAGRLRRTGAEVDLLRAGEGDPSPREYDAVVVGASIHAGRHQTDVIDWARRHAISLDAMPSAFFSVCLSAADDTDEAREAVRGYLAEAAESTGWTPRLAVTFAGALQYLEYGFVTRLMIRLMMSHKGHPTDTSRDYDYTDWAAVDRFADEVAGLARARLLATLPG